MISHSDERHHKFPGGWSPMYDEPLDLMQASMNVWVMQRDGN